MKLVSENIVNRVFEINTDEQFKEIALELYQIHAQNNEVYKEFLRYIHHDHNTVHSVHDIPFLPIQFFKSRKIVLGNQDEKAEIVFKSSGTTGQLRSQHFVKQIDLYKRSFLKAFELFYGEPQQYHILGLLPSYLEQGDSSLIYMVDHLIQKSKSESSGFFLNDYSRLSDVLKEVEKDSRQIILFGVSYALLEYAENGGCVPENIIIMETGGVKGRRKEITKNEMYQILQQNWNITAIHSEYGMTELLSQAYAKENNLFSCPPWMKILIKNPNDYKEVLPINKTGGIHVVDLANIYSCPFIATQDLGKIHPSGHFEVLGRFDHSDLRGCNLLVQ